MKRAKYLAHWAIINGALAVALYYGVVRDVDWAANLARFGVWVILLITALGSVTVFAITEKAKAGDEAAVRAVERVPDRGTYVPRWIDLSYDVAVLLTLAAAGWFVTAAAYLLSTLGTALYRGAITDAQKTVKEAA